ncbi:MAG: lamin tail domain-containing protein, partial [Candidatus Latescibacteria bacterium]|nr:lamin tail domain-containing protein [Candidatus Latescibacterota bacterium]
TFTVTDPDGHGASDAMTAMVSGVNDPPVLEAIADTVTMVGRRFRLQVFADDPDVVYGDLLSYADDSDLLDVSEDGWIAFEPEATDVGSHTIPITVTDESAASASGSFVLTVLPRPRIVINEVLCDPPSDGDANRDGAVDPYQDEFIELLNVGLDSVDIGNWRLSDDDVSSASQFVFPPGTHVAPGEYVVLFGGGAPAGFAGQVFVDDGRIGNGLTNRGDVIRLIAPDGPDTIAVLTYSDWGSDQSFVRWPEGLGDFVPHAPLPGKGRFSPGTVRTVLVSITVTPEDATIVLGKELSFSARGIFSDGSTQDLTSDVRWSSSDSTVALVHSPGRIVPVSAGGTQIRATFGAVGSLSQTLTVVWPPPVADFSASPTEG